MAKSSSGNTLRWWYLLCFAGLSAFAAWSRTHNAWASGAVGVVVLIVVGSWLAGSNAVSAYTQVLDRTAEAAHAPQHSEAYQVRRLLTRYRYEPAVEGLAELALSQLKDIEGHYRHFEKSLHAKLNEGELTYDRYHTAGTRAFDAVMVHLRTAASLIDQLARARNSELVTKLETLFAKNDEALHSFERINAALEEMSGGGVAEQRLADAISDMEQLAEQAHKYAASNRSGS